MSTEEEQKPEINESTKTNGENNVTEPEANNTNEVNSTNSNETNSTTEENNTKIDYTKLDKNACMLTSMSCLLLFTKIVLSQYDNNGYIGLVRNSSF